MYMSMRQPGLMDWIHLYYIDTDAFDEVMMTVYIFYMKMRYFIYGNTISIYFIYGNTIYGNDVYLNLMDFDPSNMSK